MIKKTVEIMGEKVFKIASFLMLEIDRAGWMNKHHGHVVAFEKILQRMEQLVGRKF